MAPNHSRPLFIRALQRIALAILATALFLGISEFVLAASGFRHKPREKVLFKPTIAGFIRTMEYLIPTHFSPPGYLWISQPDTLQTDRYGFRKPEIPFEKPPGKYRIAFLGGSTTQGANRPYPERTVRLLNASVGAHFFEMLNIACSAYSTHQSLMALERWGLPRKPDLVIIYHGWNDASVASDGYPDHRKDKWMPTDGHIATNVPLRRWIASLRLYQALSLALEKLDADWPQLRVPPDQFESNLEKMVRMARDAGARVMVFTRPASHRRPLPDVTPIAALAYKKAGFPDDPEERYKAIHQTYTAIQRRVVERNPGAELFDASAVLDRIQARHAAGEFGPDIEIFYRDAIHITEFAEQLLAEELACAIAPELAGRIRFIVNSDRYHFLMAEQFLDDMQVFEAAWHARTCIQLAGGSHPEAEKILRQAEEQFEFARLFREGRWGGADGDFDTKLRKLQKCLSMRPSDLGVCLQIFRLHIYMNRLADAAQAMSGFQPANDRDEYQWRVFTLQSHKAAGRWSEAVQTARRILELRPDDAEARDIVDKYSSRIPEPSKS